MPEDKEPAAAPEPPVRSSPPPRRLVVVWWRRMVPWAGLLLLTGCLWGLLGSFEWLAAPPGQNAPGGYRTIVIDPGHGGGDSGAIAQGVVEKDLNLDVGLRVARLLKAAGRRVKLTREDDHFVPLDRRVQMANELPAAIFVSIHFNDAQGEGHASSRANGIETYYSPTKLAAPVPRLSWANLFGGAKRPEVADPVAAGARLANCIQQSLIAGTAAADRGIKEAGLYVTRRVRGPAVLVEGGFVSHPIEAHLLRDSGYRQRIAESIAAGIVKYLQDPVPPRT